MKDLEYSDEKLIACLEEFISQLKGGRAGIVRAEVNFLFPCYGIVERKINLEYYLRSPA